MAGWRRLSIRCGRVDGLDRHRYSHADPGGKGSRRIGKVRSTRGDGSEVLATVRAGWDRPHNELWSLIRELLEGCHSDTPEVARTARPGSGVSVILYNSLVCNNFRAAGTCSRRGGMLVGAVWFVSDMCCGGPRAVQRLYCHRILFARVAPVASIRRCHLLLNACSGSGARGCHGRAEDCYPYKEDGYRWVSIQTGRVISLYRPGHSHADWIVRGSPTDRAQEIAWGGIGFQSATRGTTRTDMEVAR